MRLEDVDLGARLLLGGMSTGQASDHDAIQNGSGLPKGSVLEQVARRESDVKAQGTLYSTRREELFEMFGDVYRPSSSSMMT